MEYSFVSVKFPSSTTCPCRYPHPELEPYSRSPNNQRKESRLLAPSVSGSLPQQWNLLSRR